MYRVGTEGQLLQLFKMVHNAMVEEFNRKVKSLELTSAQVLVLGCLDQAEENELCQKDLEEILNLSNPTITGIVKRLEAKGFIERRSWEKDARYKRICLTEKARSIKTEALGCVSEIWGRFLSCLTPEEVDTLISLLYKIQNNQQNH